jgi:hypothetical protein
MDHFFAQALAPFMLLGMLLIARPISNWLRRKMPDGRLKRLLFFTWH